MDLLEYQSKMVLKKFGVKVGYFGLASNLSEVASIANKLQLSSALIKPQSHHTKKVRFASDFNGILDASQLFFDEYQQVPLMIAPYEKILARYYVAICIHPILRIPTLLLSIIPSNANGKKILFHNMHTTKLDHFELKGKDFSEIVQYLHLDPTYRAKLKTILQKLIDAFFSLDCNYLEVETLAATKDGFHILDAKLGIQENMLSNQQEMAALQTSYSEQLATENGLEYIPQNGKVGLIGNGKGFVISMMDAVSLKPCHLLDLKNIEAKKAIRLALEISLKNPLLREFFFAIFGTDQSCTDYLQTYLELREEWNLDLPCRFYFLGLDAKKAAKLAKAHGLEVVETKEMSP